MSLTPGLNFGENIAPLMSTVEMPTSKANLTAQQQFLLSDMRHQFAPPNTKKEFTDTTRERVYQLLSELLDTETREEAIEELWKEIRQEVPI